jgi:hypothetical protein
MLGKHKLQFTFASVIELRRAFLSLSLVKLSFSRLTKLVVHHHLLLLNLNPISLLGIIQSIRVHLLLLNPAIPL